MPGHRHDAGGREPLSATEPRTVASTDGVTLALHDLGGEGNPVLLAHATGFHGRVWAPCARHLPFHAWAPDLRGHGASPLPPAAFRDGEPEPRFLDWERFADDVLAVVDALTAEGTAPGGLVAAGHSKGGAALMLAEQRRPGTFRALYLYEPVIFPPAIVAGAENPLAAGARRRRASFPSFDDALANYSAKPPLDALDPAALDAYVRHGFVGQPDGTVTLACPPPVEATVFREGMHHRGFDHLAEVTCPVVIARGAVTPGPAQFAAAVADALPHGELVVHPRLGHFGPLEDPAGIAADIAAHLGPAAGAG